MKKIISKSVSLVCALAVLLSVLGFPAAKAASAGSVSLAVEGADGTVFYSPDVSLEDTDKTVSDVLKRTLDGKKIPYDFEKGNYGDYIQSINGEAQASDYSRYWSLYYDDSLANYGVSSQTVKSGDNIVVAFVSNDTLYPTVTLSAQNPAPGQQETLTLSSQVTQYDSNWKPTGTKTDPISDADVTLDGKSLGKTGSDGRLSFTLPQAEGTYTLAVGRDTQGQTSPAIVRVKKRIAVSASGSSPSSDASGSSAASSNSGSSITADVGDTAVDQAISGAADYLAQNDDSDWTAFALTRAGRTVPSGYFTSVAQRLSDNGGTFTNPNELTKTILCLRAAGADPCNFNGTNLVSLLYNYGKIDKTGANGPIYALLALDSGNYTVPSDAAWNDSKLIDTLLGYQNGDGSFSLNQGLAGDPDVTAMAVTALAPHKTDAKASDAIGRALSYLSGIQQEDGGFLPYGDSKEAAETTSQVVIALSSLGRNPATDAAFLKNGHSPLGSLMNFRTSSGGFSHNAGGQPDIISTQQALEALTAYRNLEKKQPSLFNLSSASVSGMNVRAGVSDSNSVSNPDTGSQSALPAAAAAVCLCAAALMVLQKKRQVR